MIECACFFSLFFRAIFFYANIIGTSGVNANGGSSRMTSSSSSSLPSSSSNSLNQQPSSNSTRQQSNNNPASNAPFNDATHSNNGAIVPARQIQLTDMPVEIFEKIFFYTGYKEVSNMRLVKKKITTTTTIKPLNQNSRKISITIIFSDCAVVVQFSFNDMKMHTTQIVSHSFHIILLIFEKNPYLCLCFLSLSFFHTHTYRYLHKQIKFVKRF